MDKIIILGKEVAIKYMTLKEIQDYVKTTDDELDEELIYFGIAIPMNEEIVINTLIKDKQSTIYHESIHMLIYFHNKRLLEVYNEEQLVRFTESNKHEINNIYNQIYGGNKDNVGGRHGNKHQRT